jgi:hypothetical protein
MVLDLFTFNLLHWTRFVLQWHASLSSSYFARLGKVSFDSVRALERYSVALKRLTFTLR